MFTVECWASQSPAHLSNRRDTSWRAETGGPEKRELKVAGTIRREAETAHEPTAFFGRRATAPASLTHQVIATRAPSALANLCRHAPTATHPTILGIRRARRCVAQSAMSLQHPNAHPGNKYRGRIEEGGE
ncbi:hypothetical protein FA95DRAFT_399171 [Auriscalpium vulgare]|uniref:Uncharacterized protein n=1 Tax=Auriscalpium vulgare TaxID=40419 RepID=A0ACB8RH63_9AGAM|nr:hypothetical protein FA95DRAFT_399171 [Auriscalpium vulgare]